MDHHKVTSLGRHGDGVTEAGLFAPGALPGETVTGQLEGQRLTDVKIVTPSDDRVRPPCAHFKSCGGCALQHASDTFVATWKAELVREALAHQRITCAIRPTQTSPAQSRRRATFAARRTKKGATVGFNGRASSTIVPVPNCILIEPQLKAAFSLAEALVLAVGSRKGVLDVAATLSEAGLDVAVTGGKPLDPALQMTVIGIAQEHDLARLTWDNEVVVERAAPVHRFDGIAVRTPPAGFLQATSHGEETLQTLVRDAVGSSKRVADLFAGSGTFALPLARQAEVHAVEGDAAAVQALDRGWREAQGLKRVTHEVRDLFRRPLLPDELHYDVVVLDPPRAGAAAQIAELAQADVPRIVHVSCNPQTFARDAKTLIDAGYSLSWVQPVDQFRWSTHIELVGVFQK